MKNPKQQKKKAGAVTKVAVTGCLAGVVGCSAPALQIRPQPPPEACPKGAIESMAKFGINLGDRVDSTSLSNRGDRLLSVKEGWTTAYVRWSFKKLPDGTRLSGRLIFGDRIYGRFTQATLPEGGGTVPVCFEVFQPLTRDRGREYEPGSTEGDVKVYSAVDLKAVERFE